MKHQNNTTTNTEVTMSPKEKAKELVDTYSYACQVDDEEGEDQVTLRRSTNQ